MPSRPARAGTDVQVDEQSADPVADLVAYLPNDVNTLGLPGRLRSGEGGSCAPSEADETAASGAGYC